MPYCHDHLPCMLKLAHMRLSEMMVGGVQLRFKQCFALLRVYITLSCCPQQRRFLRDVGCSSVRRLHGARPRPAGEAVHPRCMAARGMLKRRLHLPVCEFNAGALRVQALGTRRWGRQQQLNFARCPAPAVNTALLYHATSFAVVRILIT